MVDRGNATFGGSTHASLPELIARLQASALKSKEGVAVRIRNPIAAAHIAVAPLPPEANTLLIDVAPHASAPSSSSAAASLAPLMLPSALAGTYDSEDPDDDSSDDEAYPAAVLAHVLADPAAPRAADVMHLAALAFGDAAVVAAAPPPGPPPPASASTDLIQF